MPVSWPLMYKDFIEGEFRELRHYSEALEKLLETEVARVAADITKEAERVTENERGDFFEWYSEEYSRLRDAFPNILRYSLFVHSYSLLEHGLIQLADHFQRAQKLELLPRDLRQEGINRAKTYLKKVAGVKFPDTAAWEEISTLNHIRNIVVHRTGFFPDDDPRNKQIEQLISKWSEVLAIDNLRRFEFKAGFPERVIQTFETFFTELFSNLAA
jgi:hypothetical protein